MPGKQRANLQHHWHRLQPPQGCTEGQKPCSWCVSRSEDPCIGGLKRLDIMYISPSTHWLSNSWPTLGRDGWEGEHKKLPEIMIILKHWGRSPRSLHGGSNKKKHLNASTKEKRNWCCYMRLPRFSIIDWGRGSHDGSAQHPQKIIIQVSSQPK